MKKNYIVRQFTVVDRTDHDNMNLNYKTYLAEMYNNFNIKVNDKIMSKEDFHKEYTENLL